MNDLFTIESYNLDKIKDLFNSMDISRATLKDYLYRIPNFYQYVKKNGLDRDTFILYKRYLNDRNDLSTSSKNKYLNVARRLLKELARLGSIPDITQNIKSFKHDKKHKKQGLTLEEVNKVLNHIETIEDEKRRLRLKALATLLIYQGLRQVEIVRLDVSDLELTNGIAYVQGKGRLDKEIVFLHKRTVKALRKYIRTVRVKSGALFFSFSNRKSKNNRINSATIKREFKNIFKKVGVEKTVHGFRHFYITSLLQKMDVRDARKFSRHNNIEMLIVYDDEIDMLNKKDIAFSCFDEVISS